MIIGVWSYHTSLVQKNYLLNNSESGLGDEAFYGQNMLVKVGFNYNLKFLTLDLVKNFNELDCIIVFDFPKPIPRKNKKKYLFILNKIEKFNKKKILVLHECEVIKPNNWYIKNHQNWNIIFTWNDDFIDNKKYFKLNMPPRKIRDLIPPKKMPEKFSSMIASNKSVFHKLEIYTERKNCIRWYNEFQPNKFDLYGQGWDKYVFPTNNWLTRKLNKVNFLTYFFRPNYQVYKWPLSNKYDIKNLYKFQFAYENARDISGYILEKIFDSFLLNSIPIYLGANNISAHIPENCFIDRRNFKNYYDLNKYLSSISSEDYFFYIENIHNFLKSPLFYPFSVENYVKTIVDKILK